MGFLFVEQSLGAFREFKNADAVFKVGLVGRRVALDVLEAPGLLRAPVCRHPVEELGIDPPVQLVHIHGVDSLLEAIVLRLQADDRLFLVTLFVRVALAQCLADPCENLVIEREPAEHLGELLLEHLLADVGLPAPSPIAGAMVVNIPLLLDFPDDGTAAMAALDEPREREVVLGATMSLRFAAVEDGLHAVPKFSCHDRLVGAGIGAPVPVELAHVEARSQNLVNRARRDAGAAIAERQTGGARLLRHVLDGLRAVRV